MRRDHARLATIWLLVAVPTHLGRSVLGARTNPRLMTGWLRSSRPSASQEAKYRDIEYVVKITTRTADRQSPDRSH